MNKKTFITVFAMSLAFYAINHWLFPSRVVENQAQTNIQTAGPAVSQGDKFYVLENEYAQLVFSTKGGALSEINLPIKSESNKKSLVRSIGADKQLNQQSPENQKFPLFPSYVYTGKGTLEKKEGVVGGYYPLLRRTLVSASNPYDAKTIAVKPQYYAAAVGYIDGRGTDINYSIKRLSKNSIQLEGQLDGRTITKTFTINPEQPYCFDLDVQVQGDSSGLYLFSGVPEVEITSGSSNPTLKYLVKKNRGHSVEKVSLPKNINSIQALLPSWVSNSNGYFGIIMNPTMPSKAGFTMTKIEGQDIPTRLSLIDTHYNLYPAKKYPGYMNSIPLIFHDSSAKVRFLAGPYESNLLKNLDKTLTKTSYNPYFTRAMSLHGWFTFISEPFSKILLWMMQLFYAVTRSWGVSIILLTVALRLMLYPLNSWSIKATSKMQTVAPEVQKIQERYKKDPKRAQIEVVALYKERGVNPLSGCLPLLIQLPFLMGMFDVLKSVFDLRGATFIPGWINNLTAPDLLFSWSFPIPFIGTGFHLLPILLGLTMFYQQRMNGPKSVMDMSDQQRQQKAMGNIMTVVFTFMFYNFPSGLNLYWLSSMALGIAQQMYMNRNKHKPKIEIIK